MRVFAHWIVRFLPAVDVLLMSALLAGLVPLDRFRSDLAFLLIILVVPFSKYLLRRLGLYDSHRMDTAGQLVRQIVMAQTGSLCVFAVAGALLGIGDASGILLAYFTVSTVVLCAGRVLIHYALQRFRKHGYDIRNVCVVGSWKRAEELSGCFSQRPEWGLSVSCVCLRGPDGREFVTFPSGKKLSCELEDTLRDHVIDEILIAVPPESLQAESDLVRLCEQYGILGRVIFDSLPGEHSTRIEDFHGATALAVGAPRRAEGDLVKKRIFDVLVSSLGLLVFLPLIALIAIGVKLSSSGPVFFAQTRVGLNGRKFIIYKFRTMVDGAESLVRHSHRSITMGPIFKDVRDYRVTDFGRILRRFSLDELPQLFNVLRGDMSMVGPRPLPVDEASQITGESRRRFSVPPGITCLWQVNGRNNVPFDRWMQYDLQYVDQWSLSFDAVLLLRTIPAVLTRRGAY